MHLLKHLNWTIYILFILCAFLLIFCNQVIAHTITSNMNPGKPNQPITFTSTFTFNGQLGTLIAYIDYGDGSGEEVLDSNLIIPVMGNYSTTYSSSHTYSKRGGYSVRIRTVIIGGAPGIAGPNPAIMIQRVKGIEINRIQLYFENNRPEITIKRNQKSPKLSVKIDFSGSGYLKGYWEIDGIRRSYVFKNISNGPSVVLKYPVVPPIPTFKYGTHNVRFVITDPAMNINFPYAIYFVTSDTKKEFVRILLLQPVEGEGIAYKPLTFKWIPVNKASVYLISIFSKTKEKRIFSAYTRQGEYMLRSNILKVRMKQGNEYIWNVVGFNDQNDVVAESIPSAFSFNQETALLPGQSLTITKPTDQGGNKIGKQ